MKRILNYRDFNVFSLEKEVWDIDYHNHNFYEIIIVESGKGHHHLNEVTFPYGKGDIFLLTPSDRHEFIIEKNTKFLYIKFTSLFLETCLLHLKKNSAAAIELMMKRTFVFQSIVEDKQDAQQILQLSKTLLYYFTKDFNFKADLMAQMFDAILIIIAKNMAQYVENQKWLSTGADKIDNILSYISVYATEKKKMSIENMAQEFSMSTAYISIFVKKETGLSIQQHVMNHKIKAAEKLLRHSRYTISEIADTLGFNDSSHFNKFFKQHKGVTPSLFKSML